MRVRCLLVFYLLLFTFNLCKSQRFGGTPAAVKWKQVNTDTVRVIFPEGLDSIAQRIATLTQELQKNYNATIGESICKVSIVLQRDATLSNAYVSLGPYRSEFYLMPPQNAFELGAQNWADNLAIHEYRHVQQYSYFRKGLSKTMYVLFGEDGQALANAAAIPDWFFEGDAVYNETMLSEQGRGRLPLFFSGYKSLYELNRHYSYMKLRNGSYKNFIPDHYKLGYLLVAYGREKYGMDFWKNVTADAVRFKPLFYPLQGAIKTYSGISFNEFVRNAFNYYQEQWSKEKNNTALRWVTGTEHNNVVSYQYPYKGENNSLIVLKNNYKEIPAFYRINEDSSETRIAARDIAYDGYFSYNNNKIVYAAYEADIRWGNRDYSIIKMMDVNTGKEQKITEHTKYFFPDISHKEKMIVAAKINTDEHSAIDLLDTDGKLIKQIAASEDYIYSYPKFSADDKSVYIMIRNKTGEMCLQNIRISDGATTTILPFANRIIGFPVVEGDSLLYTCSNNGRDEIWGYISHENKHYRLADYSTGMYHATFNNKGQLITSAFTADGYRIAIAKALWQPINEADTLTGLYVYKPFKTTANATLAATGVRTYPVKKYPKLFHPFNFHSWRPDYNDPDYSFTIYGENVLNTIQNQLYYTYNRNEHFSRVGYNLVYGGWYVQPILGVNETFQRNIALNADTNFYWNEFKASAGLQLPLNFSGGKQYRTLTVSSTYNLDNIQWTGLSKKFLANASFNYLESRVLYTGQIQKAVRQIYPHWAQSILLQYRTAINKFTARQFLVSAAVYLPGFVKTHNIVLNAAYQARDTMGEYSYTNNFPFSRGYNSINFPRMFRLGINYHLTLCYPDIGFGNIVFFQRIRANAFYDITNLKSLRTGVNYKLQTAGGEIYFDTKWWNQQPISFGLRYSRLLDYTLTRQQPNQWELILPVRLFN